MDWIIITITTHLPALKTNFYSPSSLSSWFIIEGWLWVFFGLESPSLHLFYCSFKINKWLSHKSSFFLLSFCYFVVVLCGVVLVVVLCGVVLVVVLCGVVFLFFTVFAWFSLTDLLWSTTNSINDKVINDEDPKTWVFR